MDFKRNSEKVGMYLHLMGVSTWTVEVIEDKVILNYMGSENITSPVVVVYTKDAMSIDGSMPVFNYGCFLNFPNLFYRDMEILTRRVVINKILTYGFARG